MLKPVEQVSTRFDVHRPTMLEDSDVVEFAEVILPPLFRGLHSFTFQLNVSAFCGIGGALRAC